MKISFATALPLAAITIALLAFRSEQGPQEPGKKAQDPAPASPAKGSEQQGKEIAKDLLAQLAEQKIALDLQKGTMTVDATVNAPPDPIEYVLIHRKGKKHEAMFYTTSKPSLMNAGLLLLGFSPGKNAAFREKNPPPSIEELEKGADPLEITPPSGMPFWMTVAWTDDQGKPVECCIEDLVADIGAQEPLRTAEWIYLGGRMAPLNRGEPEVYVADFEGNLVSLIYTTPDNHLGTLKHERSRDDENWTMTERMPAHGVQVKFTFHSKKPQLVQEREARLAKEAADAQREAAQKESAQKEAAQKDEKQKEEAKKDGEAKPNGGR